MSVKREKARRLKSLSLAGLDRLLTIPVLAAYLHFWARLVLRVRKPLIIGVTGTVGKTTTSEMIAAVLRQPEAESILGKVGFAEKNMNDDIGVPATLLGFCDLNEDYAPSRLLTGCLAPFRALALILGCRPYPRVFVLEFGAGWSGHLATLAKLARPDIAVVTTIGAGHLERFGTLEGVAREKMALVRAVPPDGLVILGEGHDFVALLESASLSSVVKVGGQGVELAENITRTIARRLGVVESIVATGLRTFTPPKGRLNILRLADITLIDDSYNANPLSMKYGLDVLARTAAPGSRCVALLGFMAELGVNGGDYHRQIGAYARNSVDLLVGIGALAKDYAADHWFESSEACADQLARLLRPGDCVLVKGSASARTRVIVDRIKACVPCLSAES